MVVPSGGAGKIKTFIKYFRARKIPSVTKINLATLMRSFYSSEYIFVIYTYFIWFFLYERQNIVENYTKIFMGQGAPFSVPPSPTYFFYISGQLIKFLIVWRNYSSGHFRCSFEWCSPFFHFPFKLGRLFNQFFFPKISFPTIFRMWNALIEQIR